MVYQDLLGTTVRHDQERLRRLAARGHPNMVDELVYFL